jgi:hypothetical protein
MPAELPCSSTKTLVINYTSASNILPADGYTIQWRVVGSSIWNTVPNKTTNPITIPNVPTCYSIEGKILADCGTGELNELETFGVTGISTSCASYRLLDSGDYTYTSCTDFQPVTIYNNSGSPQAVCAVEGSVTGGQFTYLSSCIE